MTTTGETEFSDFDHGVCSMEVHGVELDGVVQDVGFVLPFDRRGHHATK